MLKKFLLASAASVLIAGAASAADLPQRTFAPPPPIVPIFTWTGFYVGVHAGYVFDDNGDISTIGLAPGNINNVAIGARPGSVSIDNEGFIGGGQVGYNYQIGSLVLGIEADISYTDLDDGVTIIGTGANPSSFSQSLDYLGTVRGRLGFAFDRLLIYATGGLAYGDVEVRADFFTPANALQFVGSQSEVQVGYTVGGGLEYAFTDNFTLKGEYLYYDLDDTTIIVNNVPGVGMGAYSSDFETKGHVVRAGLNYKFW